MVTDYVFTSALLKTYALKTNTDSIISCIFLHAIFFILLSKLVDQHKTANYCLKLDFFTDTQLLPKTKFFEQIALPKSIASVHLCM